MMRIYEFRAIRIAHYLIRTSRIRSAANKSARLVLQPKIY